MLKSELEVVYLPLHICYVLLLVFLVGKEVGYRHSNLQGCGNNCEDDGGFLHCRNGLRSCRSRSRHTRSRRLNELDDSVHH